MKIIGAWLLTFLLAAALLAFGTASQGDDGPWIFSLFFAAPIAAIGFVYLGLRWRELPRYRWLGSFHIITVAIATQMLPAYWERVTFAGDHIAAGHSADYVRSFEPEWSHSLWAPVMKLLVFAAILFSLLAWLRPAKN